MIKREPRFAQDMSNPEHAQLPAATPAPTSAEAYAEYLAKSFPVVRISGQPWYVDNRCLLPVAMPHRVGPVKLAEIRRAVWKTRAAVAIWNDGWDTAPCEWWAVCCDDKSYDIENLPSKKRRSHLRRGLRCCEVGRIELEWFAEYGYEVYAAAYRQYGSDLPTVSADDFARAAMRNAEYPGRENWGAFVDGALVAYLSCIVVDDIVMRSSSKSIPSMQWAHPNEALSYLTARHYLRERDMAYVVSGWRVLYHPTQIQDFLISLGFRRVYCPVRIALHPALNVVLRSGVHRWGAAGIGLISKLLLRRLKAVDRLVHIAKECRRLAPDRHPARDAT